MIKIAKAIVSLSNKSNIEFLANILSEYKIPAFSTGGTYAVLKKIKKSLHLKQVEDYTNFPEIMDGRVKTLHPKIYASILSERDNDEHQKVMLEHDIENINLVVVNLYPFEEKVANNNSVTEIIENIDIGGPTMVRAAAKNFQHILILIDVEDYKLLHIELERNQGYVSLDFRKNMAAKAFRYISKYDKMIADWMEKFASVTENIGKDADNHILSNKTFDNKAFDFDYSIFSNAELKENLRYGENPHQKAALYALSNRKQGEHNLIDAVQIQGKQLSYNNILDTDSALKIVKSFNKPTAVIVKHSNPCAVAIEDNILNAYKKALFSDKKSAFGGILAINHVLTKDLAELIVKHFFEVVIAPDMDQELEKILAKKSKMRVILYQKGKKLNEVSRESILANHNNQQIEIKSIIGGLLVQDIDHGKILDIDKLDYVTQRKPSQLEIEDMIFAFNVAKFVKSNAIVLAKNQATVGIGAGQMSRVDAVNVAQMKFNEYQENIKNRERENRENRENREKLSKKPEFLLPKDTSLVLASDAFFPFADNIDLAHKIGVKAIIQPGGSVRDAEVIAKANHYNIAMIMTHIRHFNH